MDEQQPEPVRPALMPHPQADRSTPERRTTAKSRYAVPPSSLFAGALVLSTELIQLQPDTSADCWIGVSGSVDGDGD